jgi:hypothetical protein
LIAGVLAACAPSDRAGDEAVAMRPDSAGWRFVRLAAAGLVVRYPLGRVRAVRDQSVARCDSMPPLLAAHPDTTQNGVLTVATGPDDFERVARAAGFERELRAPNVVCTGDGCDQERWVVRDDGPFWGREYANQLTAGPWRGLLGVVVSAGYWDEDDPARAPPAQADTVRDEDDVPDVRALPEEIFQARWFVMASRDDGCAVVLGWRGDVVRATRGGEAAATWDSATVHHLLEGTSLRDREKE